MKQFLKQPKSFWAHVRTISQALGYTRRGGGQILVPSVAQLKTALERRGLESAHVADDRDRLTAFGKTLHGYFEFRASALNEQVSKLLMDVDQARKTFRTLRRRLRPKCPLPMNKQKGAMKAPAFFTGIINMLIEANAGGSSCDFGPMQLTTVTRDQRPLRTMARRIDGAFPSAINPVAVWEIKEYYYTTTFGSRVADGVYESLLDGMEIEELREHEGIDVRHYLMIDSHFTWWVCGKSYLCRLVDMLHMGYVDEVLFGREVLNRLPKLVREWRTIDRKRAGA